jgi:hypothetical protein
MNPFSHMSLHPMQSRRGYQAIVTLVLFLFSALPLTSRVPSQHRPASKKHTWKTYTNVRFEYSVCYPSDVLVPQGEAENGDGQKFVTTDSRTEVLVYGSNNALNQLIDELYSDTIRSAEKKGIHVSYKLLRNDRFAISGEGKGKVLYEKVVLSHDVFKALRLEYPAELKSDFNSIVSGMSACFLTNLKPPSR